MPLPNIVAVSSLSPGPRHAPEAEVISVVHLYALNGTLTGPGTTIGYYKDHGAADEAGKPHVYYGTEKVPALRLADGTVYLLRQTDPVTIAG